MPNRSLDFAREVVRELHPMLYREVEGSGYDLALRDGHAKIRIDDILLAVRDEEPEVVILFRDIAHPTHLYRMRMEAMEPGTEPLFGDPGSWASVIWANFCEKIESATIRFPEGDPSRITDI